MTDFHDIKKYNSFKKLLSELNLRFPISEISQKTGHSKSNVSKYVNGISLEAVRDIFGHSDTKTTEIYGKIIKVLRFNEAKEKAGKFI